MFSASPSQHTYSLSFLFNYVGDLRILKFFFILCWSSAEAHFVILKILIFLTLGFVKELIGFLFSLFGMLWCRIRIYQNLFYLMILLSDHKFAILSIQDQLFISIRNSFLTLFLLNNSKCILSNCIYCCLMNLQKELSI